MTGILPALRPAIDARNGQPYEGDWPPQMLQQCVTAPDPVGALYEAWDMILAVDYRPIFEAGRRVLMAPAQNAAWTESVKLVANRALAVARDAASARHDLMGRIFHRLVDTARYDGSYYTSTAAAVLLAGLSIRPDDLPADLSGYSLIDPACGTGTLLMAAAERIRDLRGPEHATADAALLIEQVITGLDVNTTACHMAATTLGLLSPSTAFSRMNIRRMPLGVDSNGDTQGRVVGTTGTQKGRSPTRPRPGLGFGKTCRHWRQSRDRSQFDGPSDNEPALHTGLAAPRPVRPLRREEAQSTREGTNRWPGRAWLLSGNNVHGPR